MLLQFENAMENATLGQEHEKEGGEQASNVAIVDETTDAAPLATPEEKITPSVLSKPLQGSVETVAVGNAVISQNHGDHPKARKMTVGDGEQQRLMGGSFLENDDENEKGGVEGEGEGEGEMETEALEVTSRY